MTTLRPDHTLSDEENIRVLVTDFLEAPDRQPPVGAPKATPVTLRVTARAQAGHMPMAAVVNRAWTVSHQIASLLARDGRVDVHQVVSDGTLQRAPIAADEDTTTIEVLPWIG